MNKKMSLLQYLKKFRKEQFKELTTELERYTTYDWDKLKVGMFVQPLRPGYGHSSRLEVISKQTNSLGRCATLSDPEDDGHEYLLLELDDRGDTNRCWWNSIKIVK